MFKDLMRICDTLIERYGYENVDDILLDIEEFDETVGKALQDITEEKFELLDNLTEIRLITDSFTVDAHLDGNEYRYFLQTPSAFYYIDRKLHNYLLEIQKRLMLDNNK